MTPDPLIVEGRVIAYCTELKGRGREIITAALAPADFERHRTSIDNYFRACEPWRTWKAKTGSIRACRRGIWEAGGKAWDHVEDVPGEISRIRGEVPEVRP